MKYNKINFNIPKEELEIVEKIVLRAINLVPSIDRLSLEMDIIACHMNGCPLDLKDLFEGDKYDFIHDIGGIINHINRETGKIERCFSPRFSKRTVENE